MCSTNPLKPSKMLAQTAIYIYAGFISHQFQHKQTIIEYSTAILCLVSNQSEKQTWKSIRIMITFRDDAAQKHTHTIQTNYQRLNMFQHPAHGSGRGFVKLNVPYVVWLVLDPPIQQNCACYAFPVSLKAKPINLPLHKFVCLHTPAVYLPMFDSCCLMIPSYNNKQLINYINTGSPSIPSDKRQANNFTCSYLYIYNII